MEGETKGGSREGIYKEREGVVGGRERGTEGGMEGETKGGSGEVITKRGRVW